MICPHCSKETKETENVEEMMFEGLTVRPIDQFGVAFKDVFVPVGWRLPTLVEGVVLVNNPDFVKWSKFNDNNHDFYIIQPFDRNKGKYAAYLGYDNDYFIIYTYNYLSDYNDARGVLLLKDKGD